MREWTEWRESTSKVNKIIQKTVDRTKSLSGVIKQTLYVHVRVQTAAATYSETNVKDLEHLNTTLNRCIDIQYINILHKVRGY